MLLRGERKRRDAEDAERGEAIHRGTQRCCIEQLANNLEKTFIFYLHLAQEYSLFSDSSSTDL